MFKWLKSKKKKESGLTARKGETTEGYHQGRKAKVSVDNKGSKTSISIGDDAW